MFSPQDCPQVVNYLLRHMVTTGTGPARIHHRLRIFAGQRPRIRRISGTSASSRSRCCNCPARKPGKSKLSSRVATDQAVVHRKWALPTSMVCTGSFAGLTLSRLNTYRVSVLSGVDRCRMSTNRPGPPDRGCAVPADVRRTSATEQGPSRDTTERFRREQADVPAEQPSPSQDARLPTAHAHPCGARHLGEPSPQGSQQPRCLSGQASRS